MKINNPNRPKFPIIIKDQNEYVKNQIYLEKWGYKWNIALKNGFENTIPQHWFPMIFDDFGDNVIKISACEYERYTEIK